MGKYKQRLTITFAANLTSWRLRENGCVEGTISQSIDDIYKDGDRYIFMNTKLEHWPAAEGFWEDHFVMKTETEFYFRLNASEAYDASVA